VHVGVCIISAVIRLQQLREIKQRDVTENY